MLSLIIGLTLCVAVGAIGVAILRGVPPGGRFAGALLLVFGALLIVAGFSGTWIFLLAIAARVLS